MIRNYRLLVMFLLLLLFQHTNVKGQEKKLMYGKTPNKIFPYNNFQKAYKYFFLESVPFLGAGREKLPPKGLKEVRIGFLGPLEGSDLVSLGKQMLNGANLAIKEANDKGGYKGIPFKLMVHNDVGLWGAAANEVVKMNDEKDWVWLGSINDVVSHVALRATLKMEMMMVNTGDPDPTFTETNIPWLIRVISDDRQSSYALASYIYEKMGHKRIAVIRTNSRYGRVGIMEYMNVAVRLGHPVMIEERFDDGDTDFKMQLDNIKRIAPDGILIWGNAKESALILNQIRKLGMIQPVYASDRVVSPEFIKIAGKNAEGIVSTSPYNPNANNSKLKSFQKNYFKNFGEAPDVFAAHAYDGMSLIIKAIQKVGLNRVLIRDILMDLKTFQGYQGVTGKIILDQSGNDIGDIFMSKLENGKFKFSPVPKF
ncbi:ABC transporter substrate-binding protein [Lutibacter sp.]|uniref:ABC transporter substrate-binding protein n=1 Tax=Lutibacter sp. TaxID=1925666 RepID=UPI0025BC318D|nr:ABC transporter substrate-binding protein [Lutibacter sp.]MCF6180893.1 ABC transporter substrate-binding protein [Lutibacter sp.]